MSHHLDTPLAAQSGQLYLDDMYVFPGDHSTVLIMDVNSTITGPDVQRGFHPEARYEFKVHFDGADLETLTFRVSFGPPGGDGRQRVRLYELTGDEARDDAAGHPMMWPIFWPDDTDFSAPANQRHPSADFNADAKHIGELITAAVSANGTSADPAAYGQTVARLLLPDVLPYVTGTPAAYGFAGINGRPLADNAPEAMLSLVLNTGVDSGLRPSVGAGQRKRAFPYLVPA
jgi:Domain of unknown function (DUF4331)